jgi:hypothetical protein
MPDKLPKIIYVYDENWAYDDDEDYEDEGGQILSAGVDVPEIAGSPVGKYQLVETGTVDAVFRPDKKK